MKKHVVGLLRSGFAKDIFQAIRMASHGDSGELCAYNKFMFLEYALRDNFLKDYLVKDYQQESEIDLELLMMMARDTWYRDWLQQIKYRFQSDNDNDNNNKDNDEEREQQWPLMAKENLENLDFAFFLDLTSVVTAKTMNNSATQMIHHLWSPRVSFLSVMPGLVFSRSLNDNLSKMSRCVLSALDEFDCNDNIFNMAMRCSFGDLELSLYFLGVLASQGYALIYDFKSWMEQNLIEQEFDKIFSVLKNTSLIYYKSETYAKTCSTGVLVPPVFADSFITEENRWPFKERPIHFWPMAMLGYQMAKLGFAKYESLSAIKNLMFQEEYGHLYRESSVPLKNKLVDIEKGGQWGYDLFFEQ